MLKAAAQLTAVVDIGDISVSSELTCQIIVH